MREFTTPVGRIVWGHPCKSRPVTENDNKTPKMKADGTARQAYAFGLAIPKAEFQASVWPHMAAEAQTAYPGGVPGKFAWKYVDGDGVDGDGKPYADREGYAGCYVLSFSTELQAPGVFKFNGTKYDQLTADQLKCGDYVAVGSNIAVNVPQDKTRVPSLYINPMAVELVGYGTLIVSQGVADPNALFGGRQHQLPPGASATPIGGGGGVGMPGMGQPQPGQPAPMGAPGGMPMAPAPMGQPAPAPAPMSAPGGMPMAPAPAPMGAPPPPPAPAPVAGPQRPTDPTHIHMAGTPNEQWWINGAWTPAPAQPTMPPPAPDFVQGAPMAAPGGMPGMMPPR